MQVDIFLAFKEGLGQSIVLPSVDVRWTSTGRKKPRLSSRGFVFALPIFTASHPATIVGVHVLNFCVRDGNRWTHMTINTNSSAEEVFPFLYCAAFRGFPLSAALQLLDCTKLFQVCQPLFKDLVTHTGFEPMLTA